MSGGLIMSSGSSHGSRLGRESFRHKLQPLQVAKSSHDRSEVDVDEKKDDTHGAPAGQKLSPKSETTIARRICELSQLESPQLRELAARLGTMLKVEKPPSFRDQVRNPYADLKVGDQWERIQGCNDWKGLLDPLDRNLKGEIIRYGEFAQATYDAFERVTYSEKYNRLKYKEDDLFERLGLESRGYKVAKFLYGTTKFNLPNIFARFIDHDEKDTANDGGKQSNWIYRICGRMRFPGRDYSLRATGHFGCLARYQHHMGVDKRPEGLHGSNWVWTREHERSSVRVEAGFLSIYTSKNESSRHNKTGSAHDQVVDAVKSLVLKYKHEGKLSITLTGHSLGSSLAILCAYDLAASNMNLLTNTPSAPQRWDSKSHQSHVEDVRVGHDHRGTKFFQDSKHSRSRSRGSNGTGVTKSFGHKGDPFNKFPKDKIPITVYSFGGPRVGNRAFRDRVQELGVAVLRVVNIHDRVTQMPGLVNVNAGLAKVQEKLHSLSTATHVLPSYEHVGVKLEIDHTKSRYLKQISEKSLRRPHNLEAYLHVVDAYQGSDKPYEKTFRDHALVNKHVDFLKDELCIPPCWWAEENKGLVRNNEGEWRFPGRDDDINLLDSEPQQEDKEFWQAVDNATAKSEADMPQNSY